MLAHPFLSSAIARLPLIELEADSPWQTAATDGYNIFWSRAFFNNLSDEEIAGVLAHEVIHVLLGHIERMEDREHFRWNIAIDHATNLILLEHGFKLPEPNLSDRKYVNMTAEAIYGDLSKSQSKSHVRVRRIGRSASSSASSKDKSYQRGFDAHIDPTDPRLPPDTQMNRPSLFELERLKRDLVREMRDELADYKRYGRIGGDLAEAIQRSGKPRMSWRQVLSQFVSGIRRDDYRFLPPSRRHLWRGFYLPSVGVPGPRLIVCAIDTSGSINVEFARRFLAEVHGLLMSAQCRLFVLQCDTRITQSTVYDAWDSPSGAVVPEKFIGGGGTDFRPVFDWVEKQILPRDGVPDLLIYLTDGFGSFPNKPPGYPTLWLMPEKSKVQIPFGRKIDIM